MGENAPMHIRENKNSGWSPRTKLIAGGVAVIGVLTVLNKVDNMAESLFDKINPIDDISAAIDAAHSTSQTIELPENPKIIEINPINFDCRARITAEVPVEGKKKHKVLGKTYRTDTVKIDAIGDVDTCVEGGTEITYDELGIATVSINAKDIKFVRPRVDEERTVAQYKKGFIGELTDLAPWVSDDEGLSERGRIFAQRVIGSSECMEDAYDETIGVVEEAYDQQAEMLGLPGINVEIQGRPDFESYSIRTEDLIVDGVNFEINKDDIVCVVQDNPGEVDQLVDETLSLMEVSGE